MSSPPVASYASSDYASRSVTSVVASIGLCFIGIVLIVLGGGFLIGIWFSIFGRSSYGPASREHVDIFIIALYACAFGCFAIAAVLLWTGVRQLYRMLTV
ncbi:MAG TPA: hypothetical protein VGB55_07970 [Tepidisphaeraceae bacterium]|jgi:hypothetical protein